ncbi:MAG TPA: photosystem reaction center subunit H, partial [Cyanobacteria bacterium UBA8543]|nr:photosystem reaction center subunit H [Cyanobacteria bacterium UBA8543]
VPVEKERVIIERTNPTNPIEVAPGEANFREGEVARMEIYEETADIQKQAVVREEVNIRKEVERDTVEAQETLRREELDIDTDGNPIIKRDR